MLELQKFIIFQNKLTIFSLNKCYSNKNILYEVEEKVFLLLTKIMTSYRIHDICNATVNSGLQKARIHMQNLFLNIKNRYI